MGKERPREKFVELDALRPITDDLHRQSVSRTHAPRKLRLSTDVRHFSLCDAIPVCSNAASSAANLLENDPTALTPLITRPPRETLTSSFRHPQASSARSKSPRKP